MTRHGLSGTDRETSKPFPVSPDTACIAAETGCLTLKNNRLAVETGWLALKNDRLAVETGWLTLKDDRLAVERN